MLKQRIITAVILLAAIIASLYISPMAFLALAAVAMGCCLWEWLRICGWNTYAAGVCGAATAAVLYGLEWFAPESMNPAASTCAMTAITGLATLIWTFLTAAVIVKRTPGWVVPKALGSVLAWIMVPASWYSLLWLFTSEAGGIVYMLSVLCVVWIADVGAYFVGRTCGGPKMAVGISPKKTWSGAVGAVVLVIAIAWILKIYAPELNLWSNELLGKAGSLAASLILFVVVVFSIAGDLFESALKRSAGIKDSSNLLPGHGGVYDRIDAQVAVLPLAVFLMLVL